MKKVKKIKTNNTTKNIWVTFIRIGSNRFAQFCLLFLALIVINIVSQKYFLRLDLTENKLYSLSKGTKNIINSYDDTVTITLYFSDNLPPDTIPITRDVKDVYEEYVRFSNGHIDFKIKNPKDSDFNQEATNAGIPEIPFRDISQDKYEIANGFLGAALTYKEQTEAIPLITQVDNLEYETTSRIYNLTNQEKVTIGFLTGHGERQSYVDFQSISQQLQRQFIIQNVDLSEGKPINPDEISVLIIAAPTEEFTDRDIFEIEQYVLRGGRLVVLAEQHSIDLETVSASLLETDINQLLTPFGVTVDKKMILDESFLPIASGFQQFAYPYWVLAQRDNIDTTNPALNSLESAVFFWTNSISNAIDDSERTFTPLISSTNKAWEEDKESFSILPEEIGFPLDQKQYVLAAIVEGKQTSRFTGKDIPEMKFEEPLTDDEEPKSDQRTKDDIRVDEGENTRILILGDADFISEDFIRSANENAILFQNIIEWMSSTEDLISIRSKNISLRPLKTSTEKDKAVTKSLNIIITPLIVVLGGFLFNYFRKKRDSRI